MYNTVEFNIPYWNAQNAVNLRSLIFCSDIYSIDTYHFLLNQIRTAEHVVYKYILYAAKYYTIGFIWGCL